MENEVVVVLREIFWVLGGLIIAVVTVGGYVLGLLSSIIDKLERIRRSI